MSRAIIHNSDYSSLDAAQNAINGYFLERNKYFYLNRKRLETKFGERSWSQANSRRAKTVRPLRIHNCDYRRTRETAGPSSSLTPAQKSLRGQASAFPICQ